ncbi:MAG TPA: enoyl-CoA hydratase/isomerase family protein [Ramlibacter sp.]|nr:enoyl-CoA hydratase/isomerase family protein [Ramlibacter sp.]
MNAQVEVRKYYAVWTVSLARPEKRNALSAQLVEDLIDVVTRAPLEGAKVLVLRGEGKCFSAGFDFSDVEAQSAGDLLLRFVRIETLLQRVAQSACLTVALTHGRNFGAGVDLAAACRWRVATADTTYRMPGLKFGLLLGTRRFADIVGAATAGSILQEAATFDAARALKIGFAQQIAETAQWDEIIARAKAQAAELDDASRAALYGALLPQRGDSDLALLVRSAAEPGLKQRIANYLGAV